LELTSLKMAKEVKSLTGKVVALNQFISQATDKCLSFFKTLKKVFEWTDECRDALKKLKAYLAQPSLLSPSIIGEELYLYLAVPTATASSALIREENVIQLPVYYTNQAF